MYALLESGAVKQYPYTYQQLKATQPNTSWPVAMPVASLADHGVVPVVVTSGPSFDPTTHALEEKTPEYVASRSRWEQVWGLRALTAQEAAQQQQRLQDEIVAATQQRLDAFAQTRHYDGILSACTYAASPSAQFSAEGQRAVQARDATWSALYAVLAAVQSGTRPMPAGYADIESELPALAWP